MIFNLDGIFVCCGAVTLSVDQIDLVRQTAAWP